MNRSKVFALLVVVVSLIVAGAMLALAEDVKKININTATLEELETLPGIGPKLGQAIIDGRPYEKVEDLLNVKGITDKKLAEFQDLVEVAAKVEDIAIVNVNTATLEELETLPGIGPKLGQAIIDGRPYKKVEDLLKVKGITDKKLAEIRDLIEVTAKAEAEDIAIVDVNTATLEELETLPGIGPKLGQAIIDGRPYEKVEDLLKVKGITDKKLAEIQDLIEVTAKVESTTKKDTAKEGSTKKVTGKINVNTATLEELETLPGIGPKLGQAIIDGRPYEKVEDLLEVKGIGDKKLAAIRDMVVVK